MNTATLSDYATPEETASVMRKATPDELWLEAQLERIAPNRFDTDVGETDALVKLVFELREARSQMVKALEYHQEQTRPIAQTMEAIAAHKEAS